MPALLQEQKYHQQLQAPQEEHFEEETATASIKFPKSRLHLTELCLLTYLATG